MIANWPNLEVSNLDTINLYFSVVHICCVAIRYSECLKICFIIHTDYNSLTDYGCYQ